MTAHEDDTDEHEYSPYLARKRSLSIQGRSTSIFISDDMWREFQEIAAAQGLTANRLGTKIKAKTKGSLGAAIRMYVINHRVNGGPA
jgi:predicted DNA-binding ribbon-helix-helix protein